MQKTCNYLGLVGGNLGRQTVGKEGDLPVSHTVVSVFDEKGGNTIFAHNLSMSIGGKQHMMGVGSKKHRIGLYWLCHHWVPSIQLFLVRNAQKRRTLLQSKASVIILSCIQIFTRPIS